MTRGYDLADALAILDRWETMTADEIREAGFDPRAFGDAGLSLPETPSTLGSQRRSTAKTKIAMRPNQKVGKESATSAPVVAR
jgi:hypothetical protein